MYRFSVLTLPHVLSVVLSAGLAIFVLRRKWTPRTTVFGLFLGAIVLWQVANVLVISSQTLETAVFWTRFAYVGVVIVPIGIFRYCLDLGGIAPPRGLLAAIYGAGALFLYLFLGTDLFLSGANHYWWGYWFKAGPWHPLYVAFLMALLLGGPWALLVKSRTFLEEEQRYQTRMVFRAFLIGSLGSLDLLPDYGIGVWPLGCVPVSVAVSMLAYLVVFEDLMEIQVVSYEDYRRAQAFLAALAPYQRQMAEMVSIPPLQPGDQVLEVACGTPSVAAAVRERGALHAGLDDRASAGIFPFPDSHFDSVLCVNSFSLLPADTPSRVFAECRRVLKPTGTLTVATPMAGSLVWRLFKANLVHARETRGAAAILPEAIRTAFPFAKVAYGLLALTHKKMRPLVPRLNVNELLPFLRKAGFRPETIRKTDQNIHLLCSARPAAVAPPPTAGPPLQHPPLPPEALEAFGRIVGTEHLLTEPETLARYNRSTLPVSRRVGVVVRPGSVEEVQQLVRAADKWRVPLYPVSVGHNWGYGSAQPVREGCVVVDLRRMNRILEVNRELGYAVLEPGVTQEEMHAFLRKNGIPFCIDATGAGPRVSLVGNAVERGFGIGPYGDHFGATCGMEVVLPSGEILRTGFGNYEEAKCRWVYKWGLGPYLDGLFTQSSFGIVTKLGLWLYPEPECVELAYFQCQDEAAIGPLVDAFRPLVMAGHVQGSLIIVNRYRALAMARQYPWDETAGETPLPEAVARALAKAGKIAAWNGIAPLYGTRAQVKANKKALRKGLEGRVDELRFVSKRTISFLDKFKWPLSILLNFDIPSAVKTLRFTYNLAWGVPGEHSLRMCYWRNTDRVTPGAHLDPDADGCGLLWFVPIVPMTGAHVQEYLDVIRPIFARHGFEQCASFTTVSQRAFDSTLPLFFDKSNPDEVRRAALCFDELLRECMKKGYIPYRSGIQTMGVLAGRPDTFWDTVQRLKDTFDPNGIISPGRYSREREQ